MHAFVAVVRCLCLCLAVAGTMIAGGCVQFESSRNLTFRVVDQQTAEPIEGATVTAHFYQMDASPIPRIVIGPPNGPFDVHSDADGFVDMKVWDLTSSWRLDARPTHAYGPVGTGINFDGPLPREGSRSGANLKPGEANIPVKLEPGEVDGREYEFVILVPRAADSP